VTLRLGLNPVAIASNELPTIPLDGEIVRAEFTVKLAVAELGEPLDSVAVIV
jgi:hypothetical protein